MSGNVDQRIITKMYEDYEKFREDLFDFRHPDSEIQKRLEQFIEILEVIKTQQLMRLSEREELKNIIQKDIDDNVPLMDIDAIKNGLRYVKLTEAIDLFYCREMAKYLELINYLLGEQQEIGPEEIQSDANVPKMLAQLIFKYDRSEDPEEKEEILEAIKGLPDEEFVKQRMKEWGVEL
jgi:hypothetical protein